MAHILFVHGMNVELRSKESFERKWFEALTRNLEAAFPDRAHSLPTAADCSLLYWSDLLPPDEEWLEHTKGIADFVDIEAIAAAGVRTLLRTAADRTSFGPAQMQSWNADIRRRLAQSVLYMSNLMELQDHVQARFKQLIRGDTCIVIGHSLGSVIAYQGLLSNAHSVDLFLTIGSPLGTPKLVYEHLAPHDWPNVSRWCNYSAVADVWSVPTPALNPLFNGDVHDVQVRHGSLFDPKTHRLDKYLEHREILNEIERSFREATERS